MFFAPEIVGIRDQGLGIRGDPLRPLRGHLPRQDGGGCGLGVLLVVVE